MNIFNKFKQTKNGTMVGYIEDRHYCLLETISLLKYRAFELYKEGFGNEIEILNVILTLRDLCEKSQSMAKHISVDKLMQLNFELGVFYKEFVLLCEKQKVNNPFANLETKDIWIELGILYEIDREYFSKPERRRFKLSDEISTADLEMKMYDTLFYLREHFIFNFDEDETDITKLIAIIDKYLEELEKLVDSRTNQNNTDENENISFKLGKIVEALDTIAYDYDIPNELSSAFCGNITEFYLILSKVITELNKAKRDAENFKERQESIRNKKINE